jgi:hypothetical protein
VSAALITAVLGGAAVVSASLAIAEADEDDDTAVNQTQSDPSAVAGLSAPAAAEV